MSTSPCPWDAFTPDHFLTCEPLLCAWIRQPANAFSSFAFLIAGVLLWRRGRRDQVFSDQAFALGTSFIGVASFLAHASLVRIFGLLDFAAIFAMFSLIFVFSLDRFCRHRSILHFSRTYSVILLPLLITEVTFSWLRIPIFIVVLSVLLVMEYVHFRRLRSATKQYQPLVLALGAFTFGATAILLELTQTICIKQTHWFQLHAIWHISNSICLYFIAGYFRQFGNVSKRLDHSVASGSST